MVEKILILQVLDLQILICKTAGMYRTEMDKMICVLEDLKYSVQILPEGHITKEVKNYVEILAKCFYNKKEL